MEAYAFYGTLKPGGSRWHLIEDQVNLIGTTYFWGYLRNFEDQFPVFCTDYNDWLDDVDYQPVEVALVVPRPHVDTNAFRNMIDEIEGHPHLFQRVERIIDQDDLPDQLVGALDVDVDDDIQIEAHLYVQAAPFLSNGPIIKSGSWEV